MHNVSRGRDYAEVLKARPGLCKTQQSSRSYSGEVDSCEYKGPRDQPEATCQEELSSQSSWVGMEGKSRTLKGAGAENAEQSGMGI